jgi:uncharacterized membrane protein
MNRYLAGFVGAAVVFSSLDAVWLTITGPRVYRPVLGTIMIDKFRLAPAIAFYLIYLSGVTFFAIAPGLEKGTWTTSAMFGAALGFVAYATYDLTNQATLTVWSLQITLLDLAWGTFVTAAGASAGFLAASWASGR